MKEFIDKLSSYNIFNYLLPGTIFAGLGDKLTSYSLIQENILIGLFLYYFIGLIISRFGSLTLEPLLKFEIKIRNRKFQFLQFKPRKDYLKASKLDPKVEILSEQNNMFQTLCSLPIALIVFMIYDKMIKDNLRWDPDINNYIFFVGLFVLFLFSYRKQTGYVTESIETALEKEEK